MYATCTGDLEVSGAEKPVKKKGLVFFRSNGETPEVDTMSELVQCIEVGPNALQMMHTVLSNVYAPTFKAPHIETSLSEVVLKDLNEQMNRVVATSYMTLGKMNGETFLPLPPAESYTSLEKDKHNKDSLHVLESMIIMWTGQIRDILAQESETPLLRGENPGPEFEVDFWTKKSQNLDTVHRQLFDGKIAKVIKVLENTKSTYFPAFYRLTQEVKVAREEANDNFRQLRALEPYLQEVKQNSFEDLVRVFRPLFHCILLVWKHSKQYNSTTRMVILIREICNDLIMRAENFLTQKPILEIDPQEAVDLLKESLRICITFKGVFFEYKTRANQECPSKPWIFKNSALFARMDAFLERCHDVLDLMQTILQFNKLARVEIGGTKGKILTANVQQIYTDFAQAILPFHNAEYNIVSVDTKQFEDDFYSFRLMVQDLERRIASAIMQAMDDGNTVMTCFKLLDSFENLLERNVISADLENKHPDLLKAYATDIRMSQEIFMVGISDPPVNSNWPPRAGAVDWVRGLRQRLDEPMERFQNIGKTIIESEEGVEVTRAYKALITSLQDFEDQHVREWCLELGLTSDAKLKQHLLRREGPDGEDEEGIFVRVNFDKALVCLLREVKYFKLLNDIRTDSLKFIDIPDSALQIYSKVETFRQYTGNLELIVNIYNNMLATLIDVERPLVQAKLDSIDKVLLKGLKHLNWKSHAIEDFIKQTMREVKDAHSTLQTCKSNVKETQALLAAFAQQIMMDRKAAKSYSVSEYCEIFDAHIHTRYAAIDAAGKEMNKNLESTLKVLKVNKTVLAWRNYVDYVNQIVIDGIVAAIIASMQYFKNQIDPLYLNQNDINPLLEIQLRLVPPDVQYEPRMGSTSNKDGMRDLLMSWINSFVNASTLVNRLDTVDYDGDYLGDIQDDIVVRHHVSQASRQIAWTEARCEAFRQCFVEYSYLWTTSINDAFEEFMQNNKNLDSNTNDPDPPLSAFDAEIAKYKQLHDEIHELPSSKTIAFLKIDAKPVKHALTTCLSKWIHAFQDYLLNKVVFSVTELSDFISFTESALDTDVRDQESMLKVMSYLRDVRKRTDTSEAMFEPLKNTVLLLAKHGVSTPGDIVSSLDNIINTSWGNLKKKATLTKEKHSNEQSQQAEKVKRNAKEFEFRAEEFFSFFKKNMPYEYSEDWEMAYASIDKIHHFVSDNPAEALPYGSLVEISKDAVRLNEMQELFELYVMEYRQIDQCVKEAKLLKMVWDMIALVTNMFSEWRTTRWDQINVELLQEESKRMAKEIKTLPREVKNWPAYKGLEDAVKNMQTSLPLVEELHHPAMRDRHWKQLMRTTGVTFQMGSNFNLGNLLDLELHKFEDDVLEIVDRAQKELTIEKQLKKLSDTWKTQEFQFPLEIEGTERYLLSVEETLMEALEDNSMQLQNLMGSKYVQGNQTFLDQVQTWQRKLGMVDVTLNAWKEVQSKWSNLQSIFVGSADIRVQLPEESKRFDAVDTEWKEMMKNAPDIPNAVEACNLDGRLESIENMLQALEKCEKALADYLETKRAAYPRFYFVAAADLLDILSKGSNPQLVLKHLPKCFDNIKTLEFDKNENGEPTKKAVGMYSGENEYVSWPNPFVCEGAVEAWMDGLTHHTHNELMALLVDAVSAFDDKPRHEFIFGWCAMLCTVVCRVVYTEDVDDSFDQLEEGNDNSLSDYNAKQIALLNKYAELILTDLASNDRKKIITLVTLDVHARDIVQYLIDTKAENNQCFSWKSQLKFQMDDKTNLCRITICDYTCFFGYEYIGNCGCLVVTPLTDRCYITLTQAMRLILGGAPAGPAGTGKTETTKDLGRAMGIMVYVFNCSDQMDYKSMGQIFKGLSQAGAWGCFDEFNRIDISVLSVVSTQWKCILDAIRSRKQRFVFEDEDIMLCHSPFCSAYITMNPGYAGRTELPESVKALFRPCAMITPDMDLICEIMLMSEGYSMGKVLAKKFMILYRLSEALLSPQKHYDWKLRAVKTTLNVAGGMLRDDRESTEDKVLLRALRDFNLGKLVADDVQIFLGMIDDLFPKTRELVVRSREVAFEEKISEAAQAMNLQAGEIFILKASQLREILVVRWSVFLIGPAGCGKSELIRVLSKAENLYGEKSTINVLNPKSVTRNELYGYIHPATREWKDGLLSQIFRDLANCFTVKHEYLVLDGDIDAEWIESMNTVMDDNKTLTLASNERIPLTPPMRLLLEIENMSQASPATVSRGGVIFLNGNDIGWQPYVKSWIGNRQVELEKTILSNLFDRYCQPVFNYLEKEAKTIVPIREVSMVQCITYLLEGLIGNGEEFFHKVKAIGQEQGTRLLEMMFAYSLIWATAGALTSDKQNDYRGNFDKWFRTEFGEGLDIPQGAPLFEFFVNTESMTFDNWSTKVEPYNHDPTGVFGNIYVSTAETLRMTALLDLLMKNRHAVMLVGGAGTGKTTIVKDKLRSMDPDSHSSMNINLNCFTDSMLLQGAMESALEKKTGRTFGPPGSKRLVYFIDDLNMPEVDKYGTQQPIALLRQLFDYAGWYSRDKLTWREINSVQTVSCLNPTAGSFYIDKRLQRSYCTFAVQLPGTEALEYIFSSILLAHFEAFSSDVKQTGSKIVKASIDLQKLVADNFLPTAVKFHYIFNLRDIGNLFEGLLRSEPAHFASSLSVIRLWAHECDRVFADRMVTEQDLSRYTDLLEVVSKKCYEGINQVNQEQIFAKPNIFTTFTFQSADDERPYTGISDSEKLRSLVAEKLAEYNESNAVMNLVLFDMAVEHICRITRTIDKPRGNSLLVGVGGSGKQSLARLSSFICGCDVFQITVTSTFGVNDFKENLLTLFTKAGIKKQPTSFILVDSQIVNERFLVFLNDFLSSGNIPDIFTNDSKDEFRNGVRNDAKQAGVQDTPENLWDFFIEQVRKNLHLILCFSPVGEQFRIRARQFPALINCTTYDYFHPWPQSALLAVAQSFITGTDGIETENYDGVAAHMAFLHTSVNDASEEFFNSERRYNYTTPKSYLDLIDLYKSMLATKKAGMRTLKERLENGLEKMESAAAQVAELQENLVKDMAVVEDKKAATDQLLAVVVQETEATNKQKASATVEEEKCTKIAEEVTAFQAECEKDMEAAEPVIQAAIEALNSLDKKSITELKALSSPPTGVDDVTNGVLVLMGGGKIPKDLTWGAAKKMMGNVDQFLNTLLSFDKDNTPVAACEWIEKNLFTKESFNPTAMKSKSNAAAGMCGWVINIVKYYRIYEVVEPKRQLLAQANEKLLAANEQLRTVREEVAELEAKLADLNEKFMNATEEKNEAIAQAEKTQSRANMADRLVNGLSDEKIRWSNSVESFGIQEKMFVGDVLLAAAFVSYVGAFSLALRNSLVLDKWLPDMIERQLPMTEGMQPLRMLAEDAVIAQWANEGLPSDTMSIQNGAIVCNCKRWPVLIDPQLQGIKWIKKKHVTEVVAMRPEDVEEEEWVQPPPTMKDMAVVQLTQPRYLNSIELAVQNGDAIMIENIGNEIDAVLEPVLSRAVIKRGRAMVIKLGDKEVEYDPKFQLYLQTKLSNPHYQPQTCAQTTLINFMITLDGLQEQLLALVVNKERPDLEQQKMELMQQQNGFKVKLKELEDELLYRLATSQGDILADVELIEGLERAKITSAEITAKAQIAKETEQQIVESRKAYVPVAARGALTYFLVDQMWVLDHMYRYSMANFVTIFKKGMDQADKDQAGGPVVAEEVEDGEEAKVDLEGRVNLLVDSACFECFSYVTQGLFERHKLIFACQLCFRMLALKGELQMDFFDFLLRGPMEAGADNPLSEWLDDRAWATLQALKQFELYERLPDEIIGSAKRFRDWYELDRPEDQPLPGDWKKMSDYHRLLIMRCLRPDRMSEALSLFVKSCVGVKYVNFRAFDLEKSFEDAGSSVPVFFILSPGVDPVRDTEILAKKFKVGTDHGNFGLVSLGQGQEPVAEKIVEEAFRDGGWGFLQNVHLTPKWTSSWLEKRCDDLDAAHPDFRLFLSAEPAALPVNLLQVCLKLTNEPPEGLKQNLMKNFTSFNDDYFETSSKPGELKAICFALSLFHAVILERKKFGPQGWNRVYPFNKGDLTSCAQVAMNYLETYSKIPWDDLKYIFGEIMYGGHITDQFDRVLALSYLDAYLKDDLMEGCELFPGFHAPATSGSVKDILEHVETTIPQESPTAFGLHPNAEIGFRMKQAESMFAQVRELQPRSAGKGEGLSPQEVAKQKVEEIMEKSPERIDVKEVLDKLEGDRSPFVNVFLQEIDRLSILQDEIRRSLLELELGLRGDLQMSEGMEKLQSALAEDRVSATWETKAYPSKRPLGLWFSNFLDRHRQLSDWTVELGTPKCTWISGLFNPQSFLTAVTQTTARKNDWPLDKMTTQTDVQKKMVDEISASAKDGAYIHGLYMEGARWDDKGGVLEDSIPKELFAKMPVINIRAVPADKADTKDMYECPVYTTQDRGPTFIFKAGLKTRSPSSKWVMAGVCLLMDVV
jgi:dynein heavy chain